MTERLPTSDANDSPGAARSARRPTIYDIAELAGVNPSTVSRALHTPGRVSATTEARVHEAARTLQYRVNPVARALQTGRTRTLGLLVADITNPVFFDITRGAERAAATHDYTLVLAESQESGDRELAAADRIIRSVDGIVLASTRLTDERIGELAGRVPVVVLNREARGVDAIVADLDPGIDQAVSHLAQLGHRQITYLAGPQHSWMSRAREVALLSATRIRGIDLHVTAPNEPTQLGGAEALASLMATGVTAVVAYNDLMAIGVLQAASDTGVPIPGRLSVIGFDNIFGSDFTSPALTTIRTPLDRMGQLAVGRILDRVGGSVNVAEQGPLETDLVVRGSTGHADDTARLTSR